MKKPEEYVTFPNADGFAYGIAMYRQDTVLALIARVQRDAVEACENSVRNIAARITAEDQDYSPNDVAALLDDAMDAIRALLEAK